MFSRKKCPGGDLAWNQHIEYKIRKKAIIEVKKIILYIYIRICDSNWNFQNLWFDSWFGFGCFSLKIRIRDSDSVNQNLWFGFVIRIRSRRIHDSDSWFGFGHAEFMIRIRSFRILWFGFVIRRIITNHESYDSRIIWFVDHWEFPSKLSLIPAIDLLPPCLERKSVVSAIFYKEILFKIVPI